MTVNAPGAPRTAIIGTGRSGTGYMSRLINESAGHASCGHEGWWRQLGARIPGLYCDSSWLALPELEADAWAGPTVHVVRHPVAVVASMLRTEFFGTHAHSPYPQYALKHCPPAAIASSPTDAALQWWLDWNARCAEVAQLTVRLEDVSDWDGGADSIAAATLDLVADVLDVKFGAGQVAAAIPRNVNHRDHPSGDNAHAAAVDEAYVWERLDGRAAQFGYAP